MFFDESEHSTLLSAVFGEREYVSNLNVIDVPNRHIRIVFSCQSYHVVDKSQRYRGKLLSQTRKYFKRAESKMKHCMFANRYPFTILRFLNQLRRS